MKSQSLLLVPYTFVLLNWAAVRALYCILRGQGAEAVWVAPRRAAAGTATGARRALTPTKP